jgi:hypothetical protein
VAVTHPGRPLFRDAAPVRWRYTAEAAASTSRRATTCRSRASFSRAAMRVPAVMSRTARCGLSLGDDEHAGRMGTRTVGGKRPVEARLAAGLWRRLREAMAGR